MLKVRFDLDQSAPPVRRTPDPHSSMPWGQVHDVVQAAFGWEDAHLHWFADREP